MSGEGNSFEYEERLVALIDVLGFSQLTVASAEEQYAKEKLGLFVDVSFQFREFVSTFVDFALGDFFSDTFVLSAPPVFAFHLVREIGQLSRALLTLGLPCRGGISAGPLFHRK